MTFASYRIPRLCLASSFNLEVWVTLKFEWDTQLGLAYQSICTFLSDLSWIAQNMQSWPLRSPFYRDLCCIPQYEVVESIPLQRAKMANCNKIRSLVQKEGSRSIWCVDNFKIVPAKVNRALSCCKYPVDIYAVPKFHRVYCVSFLVISFFKLQIQKLKRVRVPRCFIQHFHDCSHSPV